MLRILIADDHAIVRRGLIEIIMEAFPSADIKEASDAEELIKKVMKENWSVIITDLSMPGRSGLEALQQIKLYDSKLPVLVLSVYPEDQYAIRVLKAGAAGYLNKDMAPEELVKALQSVLAGKKYITSSIADKLASGVDFNSQKQPHEQLSDREFEVFKLLATGKSISEIGELFHLGVTTISTYRSRIMSKMNKKTNADLTLYAIENGLI